VTLLLLLVKLTLVVLSNGLLLWGLRRHSAAERHQVLMATFAALLLVPGLQGALPSVTPGWLQRLMPPSAPASSPPGPLDFPASTGTANRTELAGEHAASPTAIAGSDAVAPPLRLILTAAWLAGALVSLVPLLLSLLHRRALVRFAPRIRSASWDPIARRLCRSLGLSRRVTLIRGGPATLPHTWGVRSPVVLLPAVADSWNGTEREAVLHHELAHARRGDALALAVARAVCALYWFHPLVWRAFRRLRLEQELAADELVLATGGSRFDYAGILIDIARQLGPGRRAVAFTAALSPRSNLERRLVALLEERAPHVLSPRGRGALVLAALGGLALLAPLGAASELPDSLRSERPLVPQVGGTVGHFRVNWRIGSSETEITKVGEVILGPTVEEIHPGPGGLLRVVQRDTNSTLRRLEIRQGPDGRVVRSWQEGGRDTLISPAARAWLDSAWTYFREEVRLHDEGKALARARDSVEGAGELLPDALDPETRLRRITQLDSLAQLGRWLMARADSLVAAGHGHPSKVLPLEHERLAIGWAELRVAGYRGRWVPQSSLR